MILKQLIRYTNADALEATWVDENDVVIKCHAYGNGQMGMLRADLGPDAAEHEALIAEVEATYVPPEPEPPYVPASVTRRQAKQALLLNGLLGNVQPAIDAITDATQRGLIQIEWDDSQVFERNRPALIALGTALGLSDAQLDALFIEAAQL